MKKYLTFFGLYFKDESAYKVDIILSMAINIIYFFIYFCVWKAVYTNSVINDINNYSLSNTITYYLVATIFFKIDAGEQIMLSEWIWHGELSKDLIRPWNIKLVQFIMFGANVIYSLMMYIPFVIILFLVFSNYITLPSFEYFIYFIITATLSILLGLAFFSIIHGLTFKLGDPAGRISLVSYLVAGAAGGFFPLDFLPQKIQWVFVHLPFRFMFNEPIKVFLEKLTISQIHYMWLEIIVWIIIFYLIFHYIFKSGLKTFTGVGR